MGTATPRQRPPRHRTRRATRSNPRDSNKCIDGSLSLGTAANTRSVPRDRKSRSDSRTRARPEPIPRARGSTATKYTYPMGGVPRKRMPSRKPAIDDSPSATRKGQACRIPRTAKYAYTRSNEARAILTMAARSAIVASRIRTGHGIAHGRRTFPFQRLDVPFHLQEDREERQDARVDVGTVTRGARVLSRLVQQPVEHLAVFLSQCTSIVHPVVQDRLEVQSIRRNRAAHSHEDWSRRIRWDAGEGSVKVHVDAGPFPTPLNPEEASRLLIQEYSRMAIEYDAHVTPYHAPIARRLLELARVEEGERILDIGCGTGVVAFEAAAAVGEGGSVVGIDLAERAVRLAADKAAAAGLRHVRFEVMDSRALRV